MSLLTYLKSEGIVETFLKSCDDEGLQDDLSILDCMTWTTTEEGNEFWKKHHENSNNTSFTKEDILELRQKYPERFI